MSIFAVGRGPDKRLGSVRSNSPEFNVKFPKGVGKLYAVVSPAIEPDGGVCKRAVSKQRSG